MQGCRLEPTTAVPITVQELTINRPGERAEDRSKCDQLARSIAGSRSKDNDSSGTDLKSMHVAKKSSFTDRNYSFNDDEG